MCNREENGKGVISHIYPRPIKHYPKLVCIDLQPYQTVQACERTDIMNFGGFRDAVFNVISAFLADNNQRFVAEVEAIELKKRVGLRSDCYMFET